MFRRTCWSLLHRSLFNDRPLCWRPLFS